MEGRQASVPVDGDRAELRREQRYVTMLYQRLDRLRAQAAEQLERAQRQDGGNRFQARLDRDALVARHAQRLARLSAVERGLCFGRLDRRDGSHVYVGRLGLFDDEQQPLLVDWRAPAARPFYQATPAAPGDVLRRRHLRTSGRRVVALDDEVMDLDTLRDAERGTLGGEAALLASLMASRSGRMGEIVATIQAEQDRIVRAGLPGILVVQGGPGTGKTVVALHRAAYLLYTHRRRLAGSGVLVVGPNPTFLRYIEQVLPSLGETDVLLSTVEDLYPRVTVTATEPVAVAALKGDTRMAAALAAAVDERQRVPAGGLDVTVDGQALQVDEATCERARQRARATGAPHNRARDTFERELVESLSRRMVARLTADLPEVDLPEDDLMGPDVPSHRLLDGELASLREELATAPPVAAAAAALWPELTPEELVASVLAEPERLDGHLDARERELLRRDPGAGWALADVPLLDEAAALLGTGGGAGEAGATRRREDEDAERELDYARGVLEMTGVDGRVVDAATVAARQRPGQAPGSIAERARHDRDWAFGHVVVDEAQELSPMAWRMLLRRCPRRSLTVVGDVAQASAAWGARSWAQALEPHAAGRWRVAELTVNYRTPAEIMALAADVLTTAAPGLAPPRSVRSGGAPPWHLQLEAGHWPARLPALVAAELAEVAGGRLAVLAGTARLPGVTALLTTVLPEAAGGPGALDAPVAVLGVDEAKGLEFDAVIVVDPAALLAASPRGASDLYMALTRATQRLGIVHPGPLPGSLRRAVPRAPLTG